jgi:PAS domain S-box-containing protein
MERDGIPLTQIVNSPEILQAIVGAAPVGIVLLDLDGNVSMWNPTAERIFGWRADEVVGTPLPYLSAAESAVFKQLRQRVQSGGAFSGREVRRQRRDGEWIDLSVNDAPLYDAKGQAVGVVAIITDVTEQKKAQAQATYQAKLVDTVSDAIISVDLQFRIQSWNRAAGQLYGWDEQEALGQISRELLHTEYVGQSVEAVDLLLAELGIWRGELRQWHRDGSTLLVQSSIAALRDAHETPIGYVFVNHDMTARKLAEAEVQRLNAELEDRVLERTAQLEAVNREMETFAYSVSHDLRAPLRSIDGFSNVLVQEYSGKLDEQGHHYIERIRSGVERMGALIDGILMLSRLSRRELRTEEVDLSATACEIIETLTSQEGERHVTVHIQEGMLVKGDRDLIRSLLENLLGNAWKFTAPRADATIELGNTSIDDQLVYYVRDNGVGFSMAYADKLFSPFQRLHRSSEFAGFGIGLATVQRIVHRHGGRIWVRAAEGAGATFYFTLKWST